MKQEWECLESQRSSDERVSDLDLAKLKRPQMTVSLPVLLQFPHPKMISDHGNKYIPMFL